MSIAAEKHFTIDEYHRLTELGFFSEDDRVELIEGKIITMAAKGTNHTVCCTKLLRELSQLLGDRATLRCQDPILLRSNSEPEPDFAIVKDRDDEYLSSHPQAEDIILVIEIADSSLIYDRETKLSIYAEASIFDYWIVNLPEYQLETYSQPYQKQQGDFAYSRQEIFLPDRQINLPQFSDLILDLSQVFPKIN
jgi:Uma2 family endonuclease